MINADASSSPVLLDVNPPTDPTPPSPRLYRFEFKGTVGEYFRIWIVNTALTILTLGLYSAWAKVRTRRYFDNHTYLDGSNFDYHADPIRILKGRLIVGTLLAAYSLGGKISPAIAAVAGLVLMLAYPWILVRSMKFNLANTSYRGLRFGFDGEARESYTIYFKTLALMLVTMGLAFPLTAYWKTKFQVSNSRYGRTRFQLKLDVSSGFFGVYLKAFLVGIGCLALTIGGPFVALKSMYGDEIPKLTLMMLFVFGIEFSMLVAAATVMAGTFNLLANSSQIGTLRARSGLSDLSLSWIYFTNLIAMILSFGLLYPWAKIRATRARLNALRLDGDSESLNQFHADPDNVSARQAGADAAADLMDLDFDFGF